MDKERIKAIWDNLETPAKVILGAFIASFVFTVFIL